MKTKSSEELTIELNNAIIQSDQESLFTLVDQLGENLNPQNLLTAISYNKLSMIPYLALATAGEHNNYSLTQAFENLPNPLDALLNTYVNMVYNPEYQEFKELLLEKLIKN